MKGRKLQQRHFQEQAELVPACKAQPRRKHDLLTKPWQGASKAAPEEEEEENPSEGTPGRSSLAQGSLPGDTKGSCLA